MMKTLAPTDSPADHDLVLNLAELHERIRAMPVLAPISRIAVAVYDAKTDALRTFMDSSEGRIVLRRYMAKLADVPSLAAIAAQGIPRVVNDVSLYHMTSIHSRKICEEGYRSSYTVPLKQRSTLRGFLFFNAAKSDFFTTEVLAQLWPYAQMAAVIALLELDKIRLIRAALRTILHISHHRDEETGSHLERMSRYARLIAEGLADTHQLTDECIELICRFSPLHDVGKVAVPDRILLKPGPLDRSEYEIMKCHVAKGEDIIRVMIEDLAAGELPHVEILHHVVAHHHEAWDGSGYPNGLKGEQISLAGRIAAVADVFDALTSQRPYKKAWSNDEAFALLQNLRGSKFYPPCVDALLGNRSEVEAIQAQFNESMVG